MDKILAGGRNSLLVLSIYENEDEEDVGVLKRRYNKIIL